MNPARCQSKCRSAVSWLSLLAGPLYVVSFAVLLAGVTEAVIPTVEISLNSKSKNAVPTTILVSHALYGPSPPEHVKVDEEYMKGQPLVVTPSDNWFLCKSSEEEIGDDEALKLTKGAWMLVPRGGCSFEHKTWIAQSMYKAFGVIVHNTLDSKYAFNETDNSIKWPHEFYDYDCSKAKADIPTEDLHFFSTPDEAASDIGGNGPYDFVMNDPLLSGDTNSNLCKLHDSKSLENCPSKRCLVAHNESDYDSAYGGAVKDTTRVCCAWDLLMNPFPDIDLDKNVTISIPTLFATMEQYETLSTAVQESSSLTITVYSRWRPEYNFSAILIVLLGVGVATYAAYNSAKDYHIGASKLWKRINLGSTNRAEAPNNPRPSGDSLVPRNNSSLSEESLELEPIHALFFLIMSSTGLFVLFFFKIYNVVKVMYAFGCSNAFIQIIVYPMLSRLLSSRLIRCSRSQNCLRERLIYHSEEFGDFTNWDIMAGIIGYSVGLVWLYMTLFIPHAADKYAFYWITQDVLGFCMCVTFLGLIELNSIQVASVLLIVAFFYDIFFVFVTPLLFKGRSVMIEVATSGGPPKASAAWCERYPADPDCKGGDAMPMLFSVPRLFDYQGGSSMLGLGDIVLPGLLLSFAARVDAADLVCALYTAARRNNGNGEVEPENAVPPSQPVWRALLLGGYGYYFVPVSIAYAVGLFMANAAVYLMEMGQPALLYLVPCTLGTMAYKGWKRNELMSLWKGPKVLKQANYVCYVGSSTPSSDSGGEDASALGTPGEIDELEMQEEFVDETGDSIPLMPSSGNRSLGSSE